MRKIRRSVVIGLIMVLTSLAFSPGVAKAGVIWCATDLGPMATVAEENIAGTPGGDITSDKVVAVPVQAVSTEKGGSNPHK
ncbi:MAG: hypothetical protein HYX82_02415 [Chloroflexi bacterium]|nr:hypothetical protein [Chloroflexota bacterium]